jgi:hypothetical protein
MGDRNGYDVTFTGFEEIPMLSVSGSIVAALTNT